MMVWKEWELDTDLSKQNAEQWKKDTINAKLDDKIINKTILHVIFVFVHKPCESDTPLLKVHLTPKIAVRLSISRLSLGSEISNPVEVFFITSSLILKNHGIMNESETWVLILNWEDPKITGQLNSRCWP